MNRAETLEHLAWLCRNGRAVTAPVVEASGWTELDAVLPGGGWQAGTIVELMPAATGIGELRLLLPALARITGAGRHVALIAPPYIPFAPALSQHGVRLERVLVIQAQQADDICGLPSSHCAADLSAPCSPGRRRSAIVRSADCNSPPKPAAAPDSCIAPSTPRANLRRPRCA